MTTDTYDAVGDVVATNPVTDISLGRVREVMKSFEGTYLQTPPPYCAKKIDGKKFYELARRGEETPKEKKPVQVYGFETTLDQPDRAILGADLGPEIPFELRCASGTYARSLAHHLGEELQCGAHLSQLRRTRIGNFALETSCSLDELEDAEGVEALATAWIDFDQIPLPFPDVEADVRQEKRIRHGQTMLVPGLDGVEGDWVKVTNSRRQFIAVGTVVESHGDGGVGVIQPKIVFQT